MKCKTFLKGIACVIGFFLLGLIGMIIYARYNEDSLIQKGLQRGYESLYIKYYLNDFKVIESKKFGNYLSFAGTGDLVKLNDYLDRFEDGEGARRDEQQITKMDEWEVTTKKFISLRTKQKTLPLRERYPSPAYASLLNENGYIEVAGVLYHDTGDEVYIVDQKSRSVDNETLFFTQKGSTSQEKISENGLTSENRSLQSRGGYDCDWDYIEGSKEKSNYCRGDATFQAWAELDHWTHYITGNERMYLRAYSWTLDCDHREAYPQREYKFCYDQNVKIKDYDSDWSMEGGYHCTTVIGDSGRSIKLYAADDICLKDFDLDVTVTTLERGGNIGKHESLYPSVHY